jgi:hypothetical protein
MASDLRTWPTDGQKDAIDNNSNVGNDGTDFWIWNHSMKALEEGKKATQSGFLFLVADVLSLVNREASMTIAR